MASDISSLVLVGCGKMGGALLERWKQSSAIAHFHVVDPQPAQAGDARVSWHRGLDTLPASLVPDVIALCVKPQQLAALLPSYRERFAANHPLYLSIAAGKTLAFYTNHLGAHAHVVRVMPNTPALVGAGISVLCAASTLPASNRKIATDLMEAVGACEWLDDESLMDSVTALSGCGPAYVFLFVESLIRAGIDAGLPEALAKKLALHTVSGSMTLAAHSTHSFEQLRQQVASPGGATEAALRMLMKQDTFQLLIHEAVQAAQKRSHELAALDTQT